MLAYLRDVAAGRHRSCSKGTCLPRREAEFAARLATLRDDELMKLDIHNCRTTHSGAYGAAIGAAQAPVTHGVSLVGTAIGLRRVNVAQRRLEMIHQELASRGLPAHRQTKRDYLIPLGVAALSTGVVAGVHALPFPGIADAAAALGVVGGAEMAEETTSTLTEAGSEGVVSKRLPETGRTGMWMEKLRISRSVSGLSSLLVPQSAPAAANPAASAPTSPLLEGLEVPPLPPRPPSSSLESTYGVIPEIQLS
ncbi:hypothetical protein LTR53_002098 [Teratosphaeriaceae sp. CCFEE 6253]|nr:hypothetical protein LTR53_002098 [Teratosphaeriaceae sp. CCFEE 6253]